jgi:anaerobic magnesium-protoporphyrin IX monomethyl ester cyclase
VNVVRGSCPRPCEYCLESRRGRNRWQRCFEAHAPSWVVEQMARCVADGRDIITVEDPFSCLGDAYLEALASELRRRRIRLHELNLFAEPAAFGREAMRAIRVAARCHVTIDYGVETGSARVARRLGRRFDPAAVLASIRATRAAGILPFTWWMTGLPGEGWGELAETAALIGRTMDEGGVPRWVTPLILLPGTGLSVRARALGLTRRMTTFRDYGAFSCARHSPLGLYPSLITHTTQEADGRAMLARPLALKRLIVAQWGRLEAAYRGAPDEDLLFGRRTRMLTDEPAAGFALDTFF